MFVVIHRRKPKDLAIIRNEFLDNLARVCHDEPIFYKQSNVLIIRDIRIEFRCGTHHDLVGLTSDYFDTNSYDAAFELAVRDGKAISLAKLIKLIEVMTKHGISGEELNSAIGDFNLICDTDSFIKLLDSIDQLLTMCEKKKGVD